MIELHLHQLNPLYTDNAPIVVNRDPYVLGRSSASDFQLLAPTVSRMHCRITRQGDDFFVQDLESRNGTYVNNERISLSQPLHDGDELRVAFLTFRVSHVVPTRTPPEMQLTT